MKTVLLVARVGPTRDGIQALLDSMKDVELVTVTDDIEAALAYASDTCPNLIILVIDRLSHELNEAMPALHNRCLETGILIFTHSEAARQETMNSQIATILPIGIRAVELSQAIETLLKPTSFQKEINSREVTAGKPVEKGETNARK